MRPNCSDWAYCPICNTYYCSKYDRECSEDLCSECYRNRDYEREEKVIFIINKKKEEDNEI